MSLAIQKAEFFNLDYASQFAWYADAGGPSLARRFHAALDASLNKLARQPDLGRPRHFRNPRLRGVYSFHAGRPFNKVLIFYRISGSVLQVIRLIHGARNLPRRLLEPPTASSE